MKKKIRDVTKEDFKRTCEKNIGKGCTNCDFWFLCDALTHCCVDCKYMLSEEILNGEVDIVEPKAQLTKEEKDYLKEFIKYCLSKDITIYDLKDLLE